MLGSISDHSNSGAFVTSSTYGPTWTWAIPRISSIRLPNAPMSSEQPFAPTSGPLLSSKRVWYALTFGSFVGWTEISTIADILCTTSYYIVQRILSPGPTKLRTIITRGE